MIIRYAWRHDISFVLEPRDAHNDILYLHQNLEEFWDAFDFMGIDWYEGEDDLIGDEVVVRT